MDEQRFVEDAKQARQTLRAADHIVHVTYPLVKDPKLLLGVIQNTENALYLALSSYLGFERFFRRVPPFHDNRESMLNVFTIKCTKLDQFSGDDVELFQTVSELVTAHKDAAMEFTRKQNLVMASSTMSMKTLEEKQVKDIVARAKKLIDTLVTQVEEQQ